MNKVVALGFAPDFHKLSIVWSNSGETVSRFICWEKVSVDFEVAVVVVRLELSSERSRSVRGFGLCDLYLDRGNTVLLRKV